MKNRTSAIRRRRPLDYLRRGASVMTVSVLSATVCAGGAPQTDSALIHEPGYLAPRPSGQSYTVKSSVLEETRRIFVATPPSFERTTREYPVIVVLDGDYYFESAVAAANALAEAGHIPESLVVGIQNTDRLRDTSPPGLAVSGNGGRGRADRFLDFLDDELIPALAGRFRASELVVLVGHSSGGIFVLYAAAERPEVHRWILALDAPMHLGNHWLEDQLRKRAKDRPAAPLRLVSLEARFGWTDDAWTHFVRNAPESWRLHRAPVAGESHETMVIPALYSGLKALFQDYSIVTGEGATAGERLARIDSLAADYGTTPPPRRLLVGAFEELIVRREIARARDTVERLASSYGESSEVATFRERLEVAAEDPLEGPTLEELRATPKAAAGRMMPYVGTWSGSTRDEGSTTERSLTLHLRLEDGVAAGDFTFPNGARHTLDYIALVDEELHVGYMNQMHPRGMLMYEGLVSGDVFEGKFVLRGVVFKLPNGKEIPVSRFHLTREHREHSE